MFYVSGECSAGKFFVTDTRDFSTELWSAKDLKRISREQGVKILGVSSKGVAKYTFEKALASVPDTRFKTRQRKLNFAGKSYSVGVQIVRGLWAARDRGGEALGEFDEKWYLNNLENDFSVDIDLSAFPLFRVCQHTMQQRDVMASDIGALIFPDSLRQLDNYALRGCAASRIIFNAPLEEVRVGAFANGCMSEMYLPLKKTIHLPDLLFMYCFLLERVVLSGGTSVTSATFAGCFALRDVHFSESFKLFTGAGDEPLNSGYKIQSGHVEQTRWFVWSEEPVRVCTQMLVFCAGDWYFSGDVELFKHVDEGQILLRVSEKPDLTIHFPRGKGLREKFLSQAELVKHLRKYRNIKVVEDDWREEFGKCPKKVVKSERKR